MSFHHPSCPTSSSLLQIGTKATAGEGERGEASNPGRRPLSAPCGSHLRRATARGVSVPVGVLMTGLPPLALLALTRPPPAEARGPSPSDLLGSWGRRSRRSAGDLGQGSGPRLDLDAGASRAKAGRPRVLQKWKEPLFHNVENRSEEKGQREENQKLVRQLSAIIFCDELPSQLDGPRHGLKFFTGIQDSPGRID